MKLRKEEFQRTEEQSALELFKQGIRSKETLDKYTRTLKHIVCNILEEFLEGDFEHRVVQFVKFTKEKPEYTRDLLLNISKILKQRTELPKDHLDYLNPVSIDNYFKPIKKLFDMNDIAFSMKRIYSTFPEIDNVPEGRGWTRDEIRKMLNFSSGAIDRAIILVAASSGIRAGAFSDLIWEDVIPVYSTGSKLSINPTESEKPKLVCAMLRIYRGTSEQYPAFITPEAYNALQDFKEEWKIQVGWKPKDDEYVFIKEGYLPRKASTASVKKRVERMAKKAGLRPPLPKGKKRYDAPIMNAFRRFWNKTCKETLSRDSPLASFIKKEFMMGHRGMFKLDRNYFKTQVLELAEEYLHSIPSLTISSEFRLKAENFRLRKEKGEIEITKNEIIQLKEEIKRIKLRSEISEAIKQGMLEWSEKNPDRVHPLQIAKADFGTSKSLDKIVEHYLTEHNGNIIGLKESFAKGKYTITDD